VEIIGIMAKEFKKYYIIDDNNNGYWEDELTEERKANLIYNPKTDVYHTKRNYEDYFFQNRMKNPRLTDES